MYISYPNLANQFNYVGATKSTLLFFTEPIPGEVKQLHLLLTSIMEDIPQAIIL